MSKKASFTSKAEPILPILDGKIVYISTLTVSALALVLYLVTLAPTVTLIDSGELILAATSNGVAHPPGFPLYVMLASLASYLPAGNPAQRIHILSAICGALASGMMTLAAVEALRSLTLAGKQVDNEDEPGRYARFAVLAPAIFAGLIFVTARTLWAYSTVAEVYTLNTLLILTVLWLMLRWRNAARSQADKARSDKDLYLAAFVFGLGIGVHHVTVALWLPAFALIVATTAGSGFFLSRRLLFAALAAFAGAGVYIYLPLAASRSPLMNWGDPRTLERFWWHVSGRQYQAFFEFSIARISEFGALAIREFGTPWLPVALILAAAGFVFMFRRGRQLMWPLVLVVAADIGYCLSYEIAEDKDAYYLPAFAVIALAASFGLRWLLEMIPQRFPRRASVLVVCGIIATIVAVSLRSNFAYNDRSHFFIARDYVDNVFASMEPGTMVLTTDWQFYSPSLYVREVEGRRKDAIVININQLRRSWYYGYLLQAYPEVISGSQAKVDLFLEDLRAWEKDPASYARSPELTRRISFRFNDMILALIANQARSAPVYVTSELITNRAGQDAELTKALMEKYRVLPKGLVFGLVDKNGPDDLGDPALELRGLNDGSVKFEADDVISRKVIPAYVSMFTNTGLYLASSGAHERAIGKFKQALAIDPLFEPAKQGLAASRTNLERSRNNK